MRILITGGSGFIGTNLVERCISEKLPVVNFDIDSPRNKAHNELWQKGNVSDFPQLNAAIERFGATHIVHLAARTDLGESRSLSGYAANIEGVRNLIDACVSRANLERVVFASSLLVCRNGYQPQNDNDYCPTTIYGRSKVIGEQAVRSSEQLNGRWVLIRPTSIWGPWFGPPYRDFFLAVAGGRYWHPGKSNVLKALGYVGNTVHQIIRLLQVPASQVAGKTFYLADDPPYTIREWATLIQRMINARPIREGPLWLLKTCARIGDFSQWLGWKRFPLTSFRLRNMLTSSAFDMNELVAITGKQPFNLTESVSRTVTWLQSAGYMKARPTCMASGENYSSFLEGAGTPPKTP